MALAEQAEARPGIEILARMEKRTEDPVVFTKDGERWVRMGPWLRRVLPTDGGEAFADEGDGGEAVPVTQFAGRIDEQDVAAACAPASARGSP